ncbi:MAG: hypothetical protein MK212_10240 [Saprospiraceae bacterium]|nr:hypothetical protein [Saprospiraceae bacterium]
MDNNFQTPPPNQPVEESEGTNLFEILGTVKIYAFELLKFSWLIIGLAILGGWYMRKRKMATPVTYTATLSFMLNESDQSVKSTIIGNLGLVGMSNPDAGNDLNLNKISELMVTRKLIGLALFSRQKFQGRAPIELEDYMINHYLREFKYLGDTSSSNFYFKHDSIPLFSRKENSHFMGIHQQIVRWHLKKYSSNAGIMTMNYICESEEFSKAFLETLFQELNNYYFETETRNQQIVVKAAEERKDSLKKEVIKAQGRYSRLIDSRSYNTSYNITVERELKATELGNVTASYMAAIQSAEVAKTALAQKAPVMELIDRPLYPLPKTVPNPFFHMVIGILGGLFFGIVLVIGRKLVARYLKEERAKLKQKQAAKAEIKPEIAGTD